MGLVRATKSPADPTSTYFSQINLPFVGIGTLTDGLRERRENRGPPWLQHHLSRLLPVTDTLMGPPRCDAARASVWSLSAIASQPRNVAGWILMSTTVTISSPQPKPQALKQFEICHFTRWTSTRQQDEDKAITTGRVTIPDPPRTRSRQQGSLVAGILTEMHLH